MSRTHKHIAARAYHKQVREALFGGTWKGGSGFQDLEQYFEVLRTATPQEKGTTRYGTKRRYEAGKKVKDRRSQKFKEAEQVREDIRRDLLGDHA